MILGEGSNCVFVENYAGTVARIETKGVDVTEQDDGTLLRVASGQNWHEFVLWCLHRRYYGLENLALIPGTVGAAPIQNIGAYGVEVASFIDSVNCLDIQNGQSFVLSRAECEFGYRDSIFKRTPDRQWVITSVVFWIPKHWQPATNYGELNELAHPTAQEICQRVTAIRRAKLPDPARLGNAGSFFKNPIVSSAHFATLQQDWPGIPSYAVDQERVKVPAAWLIDTLGFKGKQLGGIACHATQPLVLTNDGTGTAEQLLSLAREIRDTVKARFDITLENEVRIVGRTGMVTL